MRPAVRPMGEDDEAAPPPEGRSFLGWVALVIGVLAIGALVWALTRSGNNPPVTAPTVNPAPAAPAAVEDVTEVPSPAWGNDAGAAVEGDVVGADVTVEADAEMVDVAEGGG